jgi:hypothetical protein
VINVEEKWQCSGELVCDTNGQLQFLIAQQESCQAILEETYDRRFVKIDFLFQ